MIWDPEKKYLLSEKSIVFYCIQYMHEQYIFILHTVDRDNNDSVHE